MASELEQRLRSDLTTAMRGRDEVTTATLRMTLAALATEAVSGKSARELDDKEALAVVTREAKKRREAADAFTSAGRPELAAREQAEGEVLARYLPAQLSDAELAELVAAAVAESGAQGPKGMGAVMKVLNPRIAGRAEGGRVAAEVRKQLG
ncbi:GatB/YqeY domain-containing protein [Motilibacter deserti]|uniref:GatB/YqeY domain-containing protein n=1 Tax=Motilibacter deserti TaxID=2714956 RepID=A0ABX0GZH7_9ACTN|nr:GatB/YqeY domain-containing protein [Motilibacter deserti]NHC15076.1 GatB/YqeY domain-containing protein [Motilibacter deserti]